MITGPQGAPNSPVGRIIYAVATAFVAAGLIFLQPTEFGIKVSILASLLLTCALVPTIEHLSLRIQERRAGMHPTPRPARAPLGQRLRAGARNPVLVAVTIIVVAGMVTRPSSPVIRTSF